MTEADDRPAGPRLTVREPAGATFRVLGPGIVELSFPPAVQGVLERVYLRGHPVTGFPLRTAFALTLNVRQLDRVIRELHEDGEGDAIDLAGELVAARIALCAWWSR